MKTIEKVFKKKEDIIGELESMDIDIKMMNSYSTIETLHCGERRKK